jgi:transposase
LEVVGIDISKESFDASWVAQGKAQHHSYEYTDEGMDQFIEQAPLNACYVMEATGIYHTRLALKLYDARREVSVVNPLVIKRFSQMQLSRVKSDKADARMIREYGEANELTYWSPSSSEVLELQQAHGWLNDLIVERTRLINRQEAHTQQPRSSSFVKNQMEHQLKQLNHQIKDCEEHLKVVVKKSFKDLYERLLTIPSIGPKTAIELLIITNGFQRFEDIKALSAYVGVSPTTFESGTSIKGRGSISKMGAGRIRQLLYLCSWTAKYCNPSCAELNARLQAQGKPAKVINIAIAHKLLRQAFAVATKNQPYSEEYA